MENIRLPLKNNESITLSIPDGVNYTITELDAEEYDTLYRVDHEGEFIKVNGEVTGTLNKNTAVTFHNKREVVSPTGLLTENLPYLMMFAIASIGTVGSLYPVAQKNGENPEKNNQPKLQQKEYSRCRQRTWMILRKYLKP